MVNHKRQLLQTVLLRGFARFIAHTREKGFLSWSFHLVLISFWYYNIKFTPVSHETLLSLKLAIVTEPLER